MNGLVGTISQIKDGGPSKERIQSNAELTSLYAKKRSLYICKWRCSSKASCYLPRNAHKEFKRSRLTLFARSCAETSPRVCLEVFIFHVTRESISPNLVKLSLFD